MELLSASLESSRQPQMFPANAKHRVLQQAKKVRRCAFTAVLPSAERSSITLEYLPFVRILALSLRAGLPGHVELDDLIGAGALGLLDAIDRFSPDHGVQFSTYAQFRIRGAMLDSLRSTDGASRSLRRKARHLESARVTLTANLGRTPTESELATQLDIPLSEIQAIRQALDHLEPLPDNSTHRNERLDDPVEQLPARKEEGPLSSYLRAEQRIRLQTALSTLPIRHRRVIELYYYEEANLREIGVKMGVAESRVSQIRSIAVAKLRKQLSAPAVVYL